MTPADALRIAEDAGVDLVEISPGAEPPVCKAMDYGKYKYEQQKKAAEARKKQKTIEVKELKMRPGIEQHDFDTKLKHAMKFLGNGDKVKFTIRFRGRELANKDIGFDVMKKFKDTLIPLVEEEFDAELKVEHGPKMEGRQMTMIVGRG